MEEKNARIIIEDCDVKADLVTSQDLPDTARVFIEVDGEKKEIFRGKEFNVRRFRAVTKGAMQGDFFARTLKSISESYS